MSEIGYGYGSEWHLLRYLGYHRNELNREIERVVDGVSLEWLDVPFNCQKKLLDEEWKGIDFLGGDHSLQSHWQKFWPQTGNVQNWDAVGRVRVADCEEWVLVEAKAHLGEIKSTCGAKENGGLPAIRSALNVAKAAFDVSASRDWLAPFYQYANRLAALQFLNTHGVPARLVFLYFSGDKNPHGICPTTPADWEGRLKQMYDHLGLSGASDLESRVHSVFLQV